MSKQRKLLRTVTDVIEAFGGARALCDWSGLSRSAPCNWVNDDFIPASWFYSMTVELGRRGFDLDPNIFGCKDAASIRSPRNVKRNRLVINA